jgi:copper chaperone
VDIAALYAVPGRIAAGKGFTMIELNLPTMTCGHCVKTVTETVKRVDAAATLSIDLPSHQVRIDSTQPLQRFAAALSEEGYAPA